MQKYFSKVERRAIVLTLLLVLTAASPSQTAEENSMWKIADGPLQTRWAEAVNPDNVHGEYPRPQFVRKAWQNLNGLWEYAIRPQFGDKPSVFDGKILVPFPVESALSGVMKPVGEENQLWYRRTFEIPEEWKDKQIRLNFGAVDWECQVWINDQLVGEHRGGYNAFSFNITHALQKSGKQEIVVAVWDPVDAGMQARGKQVAKPHAIWYTSVTGIWQTVWLEPVHEVYLRSAKIVPDIDAGAVRIEGVGDGVESGMEIEARVLVKDKIIASERWDAHQEQAIPIADAQLWSPDSPFLYDLKLTLFDKKGKVLDEVNSYFGMRKTSLGKDENGAQKLFLNNEELFHYGPLDQGWWPDGLYTAPTDEALKYDIEVTRQLGFNMIRKHVKIEPDRWYYWCDKLGVMVWQDMPNGDTHIGPNEPDIVRSGQSARQFRYELRQMIKNFGNHPSIVMWVPFNEGWGQFDTPSIVDLIRKLDPSRLINNVSGWADRSVGDVHDIHAYPGPAMPPLEDNRAAVLGEFGGLGLPLEGHTWQSADNWGYRQYETVEDLTVAYRELLRRLYHLRGDGLAAAVYTQTTDVEIEVNGLMTYDRAVIKMPAEKVRRINAGFLPPIVQADYNIFIDEAEIKLLNSIQKGDIFYTLDGSEPTERSLRYTDVLGIGQSTTVTARTRWLDGSWSQSASRRFEQVEKQPALRLDSPLPGLECHYFQKEGERWEKLPDFAMLEPYATGIVKNIDLSFAKRTEMYGLVFSGYLQAPADGVYSFYTNSDDGSKLYIDDIEVVDNDYNHGMLEKRGDIALEAGYHNITVTFFQGTGGQGLEVFMRGPGIVKRKIDAGVLFH